jgi:CheY-like chemotaxis protein
MKRLKLEQETLKSQRIESVGLLAGGIAHDFNNYLCSIVNNIEIVKGRIVDDGESEWHLLKAEKVAMNARKLSEQLLTFSKGGKPKMERVNLVDLVKNATQFALSGSNIRPIFKMESNIPCVQADSGQLDQVFSNLVINAKQAMPNGGKLKIIVKMSELCGNETTHLQDGCYIRIEFKDEGVGIPKELQDKIFDPFFTTKAEGKGLGLTTALSIIRNHGGDIQVESQLGIGSSFIVYLPELESEPDDSPEIITSESTDLIRGNVLIMDDDEEIVEVLGTLLSTIGYSVTVTKNGEEAIAAYRKAMEEGQKFMTAIIDLTIKDGMGGKDAIKEILAIDPKLKAIVSSGYSNDPILADPKEYGFCAVLTKPYSMKELRRTIQNVVGLEKADDVRDQSSSMTAASHISPGLIQTATTQHYKMP